MEKADMVAADDDPESAEDQRDDDAEGTPHCTCPRHANGFRKEDNPACPLHGGA